MTDVENLLSGRGLQAQIPIVRTTTIGRANFKVEPFEGGFHLFFDLLFSPEAAERYVITFDADGFERFKAQLQAAGTGIEIGRVLPFNGDDR